MAQANISIRVDEKVKQQFDKICDELGLTMSSAINMFIKTMIREEAMPFTPSLHVPNAETRKVIEDIENGIGLSGPFKSVEDLMKALDSEDE